MFYIKRITLHTGTDVKSTVDFAPGLNIVYGQSNTGKSLILDCIDYMAGAEDHRFDAKLDVKKITMLVCDGDSSLTLEREIESRKIEVSSRFTDIESGTYSIGKAKKSINSVWLKLMGIDPDAQILMTLEGKPQRFTLRTFIHLMLIDETRVQGKASILSSGQGVNKKVATSVLTSLLYLATGNNYLPDKSANGSTIRKERKKAVKDFVARSMSALENKKISELENFTKESPAELQTKINGVLDEIGAAEGALESATKESRSLAESVYKIDAQITECRVLLNRNAALLSQYESDIRRLTFITEGDVHAGDVPKIEVCPFCNGTLSKKQEESCVDAAIAEVNKIELQIKDLRSVQASINSEIDGLNKERMSVLAKRKELETLIRGELQPQITQLKGHLAGYTLALNQYKAKELIESFSNVLVKELEVTEQEESESFKFNARAKIQEVLQAMLNEELAELLKESNYENYTGAWFDVDDYDVVVNGHLKRSQGQGFRAFLNTILTIALHNCLDRCEHNKPGLLVVDSPILSLKEKADDEGDEKTSDSMKAGLFQYFVDHQDTRQTIIIENEIPKLDYSKVNVLEFTKDEDRGRYGLITGYRD